MITHNKNQSQMNLKKRYINRLGFIAGNKKLWLALALTATVLLVVGLITATTRSGAATDTGNTYTAKRGDLTVTVTEGGSIRARQSIEYKCQVERRSQTMILNIVPAGTYITQEDVNNGMVLVQLDSSTLKDSLAQEEMELASDEEQYTAAVESYKIRVKQNESDIANAEMTVRFAKMDLQKYLGDEIAEQLIKDVNTAANLSKYVAPIIFQVREDPNVLQGSAASQRLKQLKDDIVLAKGNLATAEATLAGTKKLHDANYVSDLDLQRDELSVMNRRFSSESSEVDIDLFLRYDLPKEAEQYLSNYIEAQRSLDRTYAECRSRLAQAQATRSMAEQRKQSQQERVDELKQQIDYCTIKAKAPGLVIYGQSGGDDRFRRMRGTNIIAVGESVTEGQTIISMPNTAEMVAEISVHETEVDKVKVGQPATIVMDAFPDKVLNGEVIEVAPLPDEQRGWLNPDLKVYKTIVLIKGRHDFLKTQMSCRATIFVQQLKDALIVPIQVVANRGGKKVVYVSTSSGPEERDVTTGLFNDMFVQIEDGLKEGDSVLMNPPMFTTESTTVAMNAEQRQLLENAQQNGANAGQTAFAADNPGRQRGQQGMRGMMSMDIDNMPEEAIDRIMQGIQQMDPEKYQKLNALRSENPEQFKTQLQAEMQNAMQMFRQRSSQGMGGQTGGFGGGQGRQRGGSQRGPGGGQQGAGGGFQQGGRGGAGSDQQGGFGGGRSDRNSQRQGTTMNE